MTPSPAADRETLLRRLSLDLVGLPPTPQEIDAFVSDNQPGATERQVDRLLASPHYGERWARQWLDAARYADSDGFEKDKPRETWFYRDWVINAFNRDLPYNQFVVEQIAGDLLPNATQDQIVATGFLRNSMVNEEGGIDPEQFRMEAMFDRMDAIGRGILGITIQCAQCHSHKYDPLTHEDYYRMFAFLNNAHEGEHHGLHARARRCSAPRSSRSARSRTTAPQDRRLEGADAPGRRRARRTAGGRSSPGRRHLDRRRKYLPLDDDPSSPGYAPTKHQGEAHGRDPAESVTGFRLELLNDANLPRNGPGPLDQGTGALTSSRSRRARGQVGSPRR
jgi:hypothetical protein